MTPEMIYYNLNHPLAYTGNLKRLEKETTVTKKWLESQPAYTLHKVVKRKFATRSYRVGGIDHQWQADLVDMQSLKKYNEGFAHILTAIDIFTRQAFAEPIKSKRDVKQALEKIFKHRKPMLLQTDQGTEFENKDIREFYKKYKIRQFSVKSPYKAAIVERFHRTLRGRMYRYFTKNGTQKWIDVLEKLVAAYNATPHKSLKNKAPNSITEKNEMEIWLSRNSDEKMRKIPTFAIDDVVRLAKVKKTFNRGYTPNWTEELFKIHAIDANREPIMYSVKDMENEIIEGKFYKQELQKVDNVVRIEKVLKTKGERLYVKWVGHDKPSWIWKKDLV